MVNVGKHTIHGWYGIMLEKSVINIHNKKTIPTFRSELQKGDLRNHDKALKPHVLLHLRNRRCLIVHKLFVQQTGTSVTLTLSSGEVSGGSCETII